MRKLSMIVLLFLLCGMVGVLAQEKTRITYYDIDEGTGEVHTDDVVFAGYEEHNADLVGKGESKKIRWHGTTWLSGIASLIGESGPGWTEWSDWELGGYAPYSGTLESLAMELKAIYTPYNGIPVARVDFFDDGRMKSIRIPSRPSGHGSFVYYNETGDAVKIYLTVYWGKNR